MFIRPYFRTTNGKRRAYWALVESYRTERGPRQRIVAWLGQLDEAGRLGVREAALERSGETQQTLLEEPKPQWVEVNAAAVRVEGCRQFGGPWLALELIRRLGLDGFLRRVMPCGRETVPWSTSALLLIVARLCEPSSELHIAEHFYRKTALPELLGIPVEKVDDNRLYRALDALLPHKGELEVFLKEKLGELFDLEYDLLLYDVTSTYFEGEAEASPLAQRGYSRDKRGDCKQVCIGLVVSRCGMPLGYEVFAGNRSDVTTMQEVVEAMEARYGRANRIWVMDRGMICEENIEFLREGCYLLRSNVGDWSDEELWKAYIQLTEAEAAFRIHKSDLSLRPIWHQKEDRVLAHILVCFLAYVLWKTLAGLCRKGVTVQGHRGLCGASPA